MERIAIYRKLSGNSGLYWLQACQHDFVNSLLRVQRLKIVSTFHYQEPKNTMETLLQYGSFPKQVDPKQGHNIL